MNLSLISIHLSCTFFSPMIQYSMFTQKTFFALSKSSFSNFGQSFLYINSKLFQSHINKCNFDNFLKPAIYFTSFEYFLLFQENYHNFHEYFSIGKLKVDTCSFKNCRSRGYSGGAIFSICPTLLFNSYFYYCFADFGGALCVLSDLNLTNTDIRRCSAINGGCISGKHGDLYANSSSILFCTSSLSGGAINFVDYGKSIIYNLNCSYCTSDSHSSAIYFTGQSLLVFNSIFSFCTSINGIGGLCIYINCKGFVFEMNDCIFSKMKAKITATSLYLDILHFLQSKVLISSCYFYHCSKRNKICSIYCPKISSSLLARCVFSYSVDVEISNNLTVQKDNYFNCNNQQFNFKKIPKIKFFIAPHPYILSMDYALEFVIAIKYSIIFSIYLSTFILLIYEIVLVFKKIKIK